jgi:hypothetical protein
MAQSVKLADEVMALVRREAEIHSRSVAGSEAEEAFYAGRQALGRGVGLDAGGNLVYAKDDAAA